MRNLPWIAALAVAGVAGWILKPAPVSPEPPLRKFELPAQDLRSGPLRPPKISPDGRKIAYMTGDTLLWIRHLDQVRPRALSSSGAPSHFFWSPDSAFVAYTAEGKLWKVPAQGGQPISLASVQNLGFGGGGAWGPGGRIVLAAAIAGAGLQEVPADGGDLATLLKPNQPAEQNFAEPSFLPDGKGILFVISRGGGVADTIALLSQASRKEILQVKGEQLGLPVYSPTGHILYYRGTNNPGVWAVPFSLRKLGTAGQPFLVAPQAARHSVSSDGTLCLSLRPSRMYGSSRGWTAAGRWKGASANRSRDCWLRRSLRTAGWCRCPPATPLSGTCGSMMWPGISVPG